MLSDEEKQVIEYLKRRIITCYGRKGTIEFMLNDTLLNLIQKKQKEIEELKEKIKNFTIEDEKIFLQFGEIIEKKRWKNKIKAKIEELSNGTYDAKIVLQSLLEEVKEC